MVMVVRRDRFENECQQRQTESKVWTGEWTAGCEVKTTGYQGRNLYSRACHDGQIMGDSMKVRHHSEHERFPPSGRRLDLDLLRFGADVF